MSNRLYRTLQILTDLVHFDTTSRESNLALITYVETYLKAHHIDYERVYNTQKNKANLWVCLGPKVAGGIMLSGHTDVVPVDGQDWHFPPFSLTLEDNRLYGRGTADMKGFIACCLAVLPDIHREQLKKPLWLALSYDEEVGCLGVHHLLERLATLPYKPALCLVGEPTCMRPVNGHKGKVALRCHVVGKECHSAYAPQGVNAIHYAAKLIDFIVEEGQRLSMIQDQRFDPPFSTLHIGVISGGEALNIVPNLCRFDLELRYLPQQEADDVITIIKDYARHKIMPAMERISEKSDLYFETLASYPALYLDEESPWLRKLLDWTQYTRPSTVSFGTEGGLYQLAGITSVICGPGSMEQGHKPDEYIEKDQIEQCLQLLEKIINELYYA